MNLKDFVLQNQEIIEFINDRVGGDETIDKYYGTLDYATARFHTILVKISPPLSAEPTELEAKIDLLKGSEIGRAHV